MALNFTNAYMGSSVYLCILYSDSSNCGSGNDENSQWTKMGWWEMAPGQTITAWAGGFAGDVAGWNRYWYYYAYSTDGKEIWNGPYPAQVPNIAFQQCIDDNSNCVQTVGFAEIDVGANWDYTGVLVPQGYVPPQGGSSGWSASGGVGSGDPGDEGDSSDSGWSDDEDGGGGDDGGE
jgi:uncharacterized membrane protein